MRLVKKKRENSLLMLYSCVLILVKNNKTFAGRINGCEYKLPGHYSARYCSFFGSLAGFDLLHNKYKEALNIEALPPRDKWLIK